MSQAVLCMALPDVSRSILPVAVQQESTQVAFSGTGDAQKLTRVKVALLCPCGTAQAVDLWCSLPEPPRCAPELGLVLP